MPAEGLLGAARLAHSLRSGRRRRRRRSTSPVGRVVEPVLFYVGGSTGIQIDVSHQSTVFFKEMPAEGLLDCASSVRDRRREAPVSNLACRPSCRTRLFLCRGFEWTTSSGGNLEW